MSYHLDGNPKKRGVSSCCCIALVVVAILLFPITLLVLIGLGIFMPCSALWSCLRQRYQARKSANRMNKRSKEKESEKLLAVTIDDTKDGENSAGQDFRLCLLVLGLPF